MHHRNGPMLQIRMFFFGELANKHLLDSTASCFLISFFGLSQQEGRGWRSLGERIPMGQSMGHGTGLGGRVVREFYRRKGQQTGNKQHIPLLLKKKNSCVESSLWGEGACLVASHELSCPMVCGLLFPQPGIERICIPCIRSWIFNHWTTREVPCCHF